jgi:hypothetical protein
MLPKMARMLELCPCRSSTSHGTGPPRRRHTSGWLSAVQFRQYLHGYGRRRPGGGGPGTRSADRGRRPRDLIIHSPLLRAMQTVGPIDAVGGSSQPRCAWAELAEAERPALDPRPCLPLDGWDVPTRILWLLGRCGIAEPRRGAVTQARTIAQRLRALPRPASRGPHHPGDEHGFQNVLIARELRRAGWQGPWWPPTRRGQPAAYRISG